MSDLPALTRPDVWYQEVPRSIGKQTFFGIAMLLATFGGFGSWAMLAPLASAVIAQGSFVATGQNKIVQHLEGGIISDILVQEGDRVSQGQAMLTLDKTLALATNRELDLRRIRLEATQARLVAEHEHHGDLTFPPHLEAERYDPDAAMILDSQSLGFEASTASLANDVSVISSNLDALDIRMTGYGIQLQSTRNQLALLTEELDAKAALVESGLTRRSEALALQRAIFEAEGQAGRLEAELAELSEMRAKFEAQIAKTRDEYSRNALTQLQAIESELESVREQLRRSENILDRTQVVAPVSGTVVRMYYHTIGGVIETGRPIVEILPADAPLIIEVLVPRANIDSVSVNQEATVRLTGLNQRTTPVLNGLVDYVSADAIADGSTGARREVYLSRITVSPDEMQRVQGFSPTPGMPAEIMIQTQERTFAQYLAKPILDSMTRAFREE
ncbi:HlyD family type I secretion periplasmic adaptor subunit [Yoonia sp.]|uniref:HlyD family type I secretion periplasmic adaptor subunit n=1 Tax=Yoonia sp. TaxID=2212373 RepID=UPI003976B659